MKSGLLVAFATGLLLAGASLLAARHRLANGRKAVDGAFSQIDLELKSRGNLIPPLLTATAAYADPEATQAADSARAALLGADAPAAVIATDAPVQVALSRILLLQEIHPDLKASANFLRLEAQLRDAESRVAVARRKYNEAVTKYNAEIAAFPESVAARIFRFQREIGYFSAR
ncbi:MAG TPA: LemA family protein [Bryobacteraceae bacterium]|jgi:LemA protein